MKDTDYQSGRRDRSRMAEPGRERKEGRKKDTREVFHLLAKSPLATKTEGCARPKTEALNSFGSP